MIDNPFTEERLCFKFELHLPLSQLAAFSNYIYKNQLQPVNCQFTTHVNENKEIKLKVYIKKVEIFTIKGYQRITKYFKMLANV